MKLQLSLFLLFLIGLFVTSCASQQNTVTNNTKTVTKTAVVTADTTDLADNLDLEAVASVFADSKDLETFEKNLNDPDKGISNLDLNDDGKVDYLRVVDEMQGDDHLVHVQAVIGENQYQNVAEIVVHKEVKEESQVQVVGDPYVYGPNYIINPVYAAPPIMFSFFWGGFYSPWRSPFYWGYYPPYFRIRAPFPVYRYHSHVRAHVNYNHHYRHSNRHRNDFTRNHHNNNITINNNNVNIDNSKRKVNNIKNTKRENHLGENRPEKHFNNRNENTRNYHHMRENRGTFEAPHRSYSGRARGGGRGRH